MDVRRDGQHLRGFLRRHHAVQAVEEAVANPQPDALYVAHQKIYAREISGRFTSLRTAAVWLLLGIFYLTPWLHQIALISNFALLGQGGIYGVTMALQLGLLLAALLGRFVPFLPFRIAYYYVTVTASIAVGLFDRLRAGRVPIGWEKVEGTR